MDEQKKSNIAWWQPGLILFTRLSAWIVAPIMIAVLFGKFLDKSFGTDPWLFLATIIAAFAFSMVKIVRIGLKEMDADEKSANNKKQAPSTK